MSEDVISALIGAAAAIATTYAPRLYGLLSGRARYAMDDHKLVVAELHDEITRLTGRLDARIAQVDELQLAAVASAAHIAECNARLEWLESEVKRLAGKDATGGP